jgi:hypothetical protein
MKIVLTKEAKKELNRLNNLYGDENSSEYDNWDDMSKLEMLVTDAGMYAEGAYIENKFDDLQEWCRAVQEIEYDPKYLSYHPDAVKDKVNKMIKENIIIIKQN